jgi:23S rRNA (cytidine1920-2'-O)/16S rRNA (cytidine1409-2'-O)-methyltransferase
MPRRAKVRLDQYILEKGWAPDLKKAQAMIMAGDVLVSGRISTSGSLVPNDQSIQLRPRNRFVSRGGHKLEGAIQALAIDLKGARCVDVGASTGGFTDCLLQHGASEVWALDVGHGQLDSKLRADPRVHVLEGVNFRHLETTALPENLTWATVDVSFISLSLIFPKLWRVLASGGQALVLVKPQFEALPKQAPKGVVREEGLRQNLLQSVRHMAEDVGFIIHGQVDSELKGPKGNHEIFLHIERPVSQ